MDHALANLTAASLAFVGTHFALSHPLRAPLVRITGEKAFPALYSLVAFATLGWLVMAFRAVPPAHFTNRPPAPPLYLSHCSLVI